LFSQEKKIIGQLHGGNDLNEYYGRLDYSYTRSLPEYVPMKNYLDPDNSGKKTCDAFYPVSVLPEARFATEFNQVCLSAPVSFTDYSAFTPIAWEWNFSPSTYSFLEGTDKNSGSPVVSFNQAGEYDVSLRVTNAAGTSSKTSSGLISAGDFIDVGLSVAGFADSCIDNFDGLFLIGEGASTFTWEIQEDPENNFYYSVVDERTILVKINPEASFTESVSLVVKATGTHGSCSDTARANLTLIKQQNDNIQNALPLVHGVNGPFSNCCSGIEAGEPVPPFTSCTGTMSWCDEYGTGEDIVEHSVWFTLVGPASGLVAVTSQGFDNEIALYAADSWQDILDGNYVLVAANDDQSDANPFPVLENVWVSPGNTYWLQVDGSGGGMVGSFTLQVFDYNSSSEVEIKGNKDLILYPQPAKDVLHIRSPYPFTGTCLVRVYDAAGIMMFEADDLVPVAEEILVPIGNISPGFYIIRITGEECSSAFRFMKE
jgi:PKD repeat protein